MEPVRELHGIGPGCAINDRQGNTSKGITDLRGDSQRFWRAGIGRGSGCPPIVAMGRAGLSRRHNFNEHTHHVDALCRSSMGNCRNDLISH